MSGLGRCQLGMGWMLLVPGISTVVDRHGLDMPGAGKSDTPLEGLLGTKKRHTLYFSPWQEGQGVIAWLSKDVPCMIRKGLDITAGTLCGIDISRQFISTFHKTRLVLMLINSFN